jgi:hypothetical protein
MTIEPVNGRVVWYQPAMTDLLRKDTQRAYGGPFGQPAHLAATIAWVNVDGTVNLTVHQPDGMTVGRRNVPLLQAEDLERMRGEIWDGHHFARWMPYQIGQAARTAQAERAGVSGGVTRDSAGDSQGGAQRVTASRAERLDAIARLATASARDDKDCEKALETNDWDHDRALKALGGG